MNDTTAPKGVLLLAFGAPRTLEEVEPFVVAITGGRPLPPPAIDESRRRYRLIGGSSPMAAITDALANLLQERLGAGYAVAVGTMHASPSIRDAIGRLKECGVTRAVAITLVPQYSATSVGRYLAQLEAELSAAGRPFEVVPVRSWATHPKLVEAFTERVRAAVAAVPEAERGDIETVFTAHSVPMVALREGDPYEQELRATAGAVAREAGIERWRLAFQSAGRSGGEWFGPSLESTLDELASAGTRTVLVVPIHFLADNVEILYDIDIALKERADRLGVRLLRPESLNTSPLLVEALAELAINGT